VSIKLGDDEGQESHPRFIDGLLISEGLCEVKQNILLKMFKHWSKMSRGFVYVSAFVVRNTDLYMVCRGI